MKTVYLAGPIKGLSYDGCTDWREYAKSMLGEHGITGISPMRWKDNLKEEERIEGSYDTPFCRSKGIITRDRFDVFCCDVMLANLLGAEEVSIGTMIEYGWADAARKPIVTIMEEGNLHEHPIVLEATGFRVESLDEGLDVAVGLLVF